MRRNTAACSYFVEAKWSWQHMGPTNSVASRVPPWRINRSAVGGRRGVSCRPLINDSEWFEPARPDRIEFHALSDSVTAFIARHIFPRCRRPWTEWNINWPKRFSIAIEGPVSWRVIDFVTYVKCLCVCVFDKSEQVMDLTILRRRLRSRWPRRRPARPPTANTCVNQVKKTQTYPQLLSFFSLASSISISDPCFSLWRCVEILFSAQYWLLLGQPTNQTPLVFLVRPICLLICCSCFLVPHLISRRT